MALEHGHLTVFTSSTQPFITQPLSPHHHRRNLVSRAFTTFHHLLYSDFILRRLEQKSAASVLHPFFTSSRHPPRTRHFSPQLKGHKVWQDQKWPRISEQWTARKKQPRQHHIEGVRAGTLALFQRTAKYTPYYFTYIIPCHRTLLQLFLSPFHTYLKYTAQGHWERTFFWLKSSFPLSFSLSLSPSHHPPWLSLHTFFLSCNIIIIHCSRYIHSAYIAWWSIWFLNLEVW